MATRNIFCITTDPKVLDGTLPSDIYSAMAGEYETNSLSKNDAAAATARLADRFRQAGFKIANAGCQEDCAFVLTAEAASDLRQHQTNWFRPYYLKFKQAADGLDETMFATDVAAVSGLREILTEHEGDKVYFSLGTVPGLYTLMGFVRRMEPGVSYFVGATVVTVI